MRAEKLREAIERELGRSLVHTASVAAAASLACDLGDAIKRLDPSFNLRAYHQRIDNHARCARAERKSA